MGEVYNFDWEQIDEEGSFSNLYYESLKSSNADTYTNLIQTQILGEYKKDECVTLHKNRYKDLLSWIKINRTTHKVRKSAHTEVSRFKRLFGGN